MHAVREEFLLSESLIYLDSAATTQKPRCVLEAMDTFYRYEYATVHRAVYDLSQNASHKYQEVRAQVSRFLGAAYAEEIIFTRGTTASLNLIALSYGEACIQRGDEILISEMEHHSNIVPWQILCQKKGAKLLFAPLTGKGEIDMRIWEKLLSPRTKLVSVAHIANSTGTQNPLEEMIAKAHAQGAVVVVDGAQSAAHMPIDVQALDADFFAFSGHKAFGPTGVGVLYGKKALLEKMPPVEGGGDMIETVTLSGSTYQKPPLRFEAGTPMIAEVIGLGAALAFIERLGRKAIHAYEQSLVHYAIEQCQKIPGLKILGNAAKRGAIVTFVMDGMHPLDIGTFLNLKGIAVRTGHLCAQPAMRHFGVSGAVRLSFAPYNTFEEIDECIRSLGKCKKVVDE